MALTEDETDVVYEAKQRFLLKVREAFRYEKKVLLEEQFDMFVYMAQDDLSLFSPWMNSEREA